MLKKKIEEVKSLVTKNKEENNKKNIENLVIFLVLLIVVLIAINTIWKEDDKKQNVETIGEKVLATENIVNIDNGEIITDLEKKLENILSKLEGVSTVSVLVTYSESSKISALYDESIKESTTEETDTNGGKRTIGEKNTDKTVIYSEESGSKTPVTEKVTMPKIEGAVVIAKGASNSNVKNNITQAVEALTGLPIHKIQVFEMKEEY